MMKSCATCEFWLMLKQGDSTGFCRRYPPIIERIGLSKFPETHQDTWCGEWQLDIAKVKQIQAEARAALEGGDDADQPNEALKALYARGKAMRADEARDSEKGEE